MSIDSHVQITNAILKNFRRSDGKVMYLDLTTGKIGACSSGDLGTKNGYFSNEIETYLNKNFEDPYIKVINKIKPLLRNEKTSVALTVDDEQQVKKSIKNMILRSQLVKYSIIKNSQTAPMFATQIQNQLPFAFSYGFDYFKKIDDYKMTILINNTEKQFIIARNCIYTIVVKEECWYITPISPKAAVALIPASYHGDFFDQSDSRIGYISLEEDIKYMNDQAVVYEYSFNTCCLPKEQEEDSRHRSVLSFIAATRKDEIEEALRFYIENKIELQRIGKMILDYMEDYALEEKEGENE